MPPRWPRQPDRADPDYRRLDDRMNFAVHVAVFLASNSGLWFVHQLRQCDWPWLLPLSGIWLGALVLHLLYILVIADYSANSHG
ncbi:MAG: hypothetical protein ACKOX2_01080 [Microcystaceae cyanobacterium]|jgi:hypothetical protein|nr:hypothetical protein [Merismopediaceae bacterium]